MHPAQLNHTDDAEIVTFEAPDSTALQVMVSAEVDIQVSTAHRFPRSIKRSLDQAMAMATLDEETAGGCMYALPRAGKTIEGPSVRLAEIFASSWGNIRIEARIVGIDDRFVTSRAVCWDLETNVATAVSVQRRITNKYGKRFDDDMINVTSNAANSVAYRNAVFKTVPRVYIDRIYAKCKEVAVGTEKTLSQKRTMVLDSFAKRGIHRAQIFVHFGIKGEEEVTLEHISVMLGVAGAIKSGEISADDAFPIPEQEDKGVADAAAKTAADKVKDKLRKATAKESTETTDVPAWATTLNMDASAYRELVSYCQGKDITLSVAEEQADKSVDVDDLYKRLENPTLL